MNFVTLQFAFFFLAVLGGGWVLRASPLVYRRFLLFANLFFYASGGLYFLPLPLLVSLVVWGTGRRLAAEASRRYVLAAGVGLCLLMLGLFKYYEFILQILNDLLAWGGFGAFRPAALADLPFPVGISFYTFQGIAYLVELHRHPEERPRSYLDVLTYLSFFPTVLAGPILRPGEFFPQLEQSPGRGAHLAEGASLILGGLFKKVVLASFLSEQVVAGVFQTPELFSSPAVLIAVYAYAVQIYCDFSGYTDLALGVGRLMGFELPQNFQAPYLSLNIRDFWRRWHISLSMWLRDYLYIPLGGDRGGTGALCRNLLITMLLGGLWHGAHLRFLVWGLLHGLALTLLRLTRKFRPAPPDEDGHNTGKLTPARFCSWLLTFHFVCLAWIFFRAEDLSTARLIFERLFFWGQPGEGFPRLALPAIAVGLGLQWAGPGLRDFFMRFQSSLPWPVQAALCAFLAGIILRLGPEGTLPFIYFQF
ncbi:MAG: MBOAT family protein [Desulfovibrio sp.]|jgi:D-alanyl-lipoteichoic acid acyltransferase DltB (MBOAT superfamily)|nr:MBOAT family protein [Desulfovibrio sp.]